MSWSLRYAKEQGGAHDENEAAFEARIKKNIENAEMMRWKVDNVFDQFNPDIDEIPTTSSDKPTTSLDKLIELRNHFSDLATRNLDEKPGNAIKNKRWESYPIVKEEDLPPHYLGSKWASRYASESDRCEHGYISSNCPTCSPVGTSEVHHSKVFNLIQHLVPTLEDFALVGRREHPPIIQNVINEMAKDHMDLFPGCKHCAVLRGEQPAPVVVDEPDEVDYFSEAPDAPISKRIFGV